MVYSADYIKEKLTKELDATHVVTSPKYSDPSTMRGFTNLMVVMGLLLRWGVALHPYSGQGESPKFGDYEAQRHWQEITLNLPVNEWYQNTSRNVLNYWGLDYPPLSAYHSLILGVVAKQIDPQFVELDSSRGIESVQHKYFMRMSALIAELLVYFPPLIMYFKTTKSNVALGLMYPALILIDHGHFQYNSVSMGLILMAALFIKRNFFACGAIFFCLALNYKQIALYHSIPFFCYLLGHCLKQPTWLRCVQKLFKIGFFVILTFLVIWAPFLLPNPKESLQVLHRVFPIARGLYEDKVASFWCTISIVFKPQIYLTSQRVAILCASVTLLSIAPSVVDLLYRPGFKRFILSLFNASMGFFLFSYHVHEKSILFPAVAAILLYPHFPFPSACFLWFSSYSLLQLMVKDSLTLPWVALQVLYGLLVYKLVPVPNIKSVRYLTCASLLGCVVLALSYALVEPPSRYPHLFPLLIAAYSCVHFMAFMAYFTKVQLSLSTEKLHKN